MELIPYVIEKTNNGERSYDIFSRLLQDRIIMLTGEVTTEKANLIVSELLYLDSISNENIYLYINSPGGLVTAGMAIYDTMNFITSNVITICLGLAASMGAFLLSSGYKRYALLNAEVMIHQPLGGASGQATDVLIHAKWLSYTKDKLNKVLAKNTNKPIEVIARDTERDNFMSSKEALDYGLIDEIITTKDSIK
ncbi:MAG: ATP-dependent Clp protease proteolytic subunit [bacterium]